MSFRGVEHVRELTTKAGDTRQGGVATVDEDDDFQEGLVGDMDGKAVRQQLTQKSLELAQLQRTHDEYVKSSCEYERELEIEVDRYEKKTLQLEQAVVLLEHAKNDLGSSMGDIKEELQTSQRREHMLQMQIDEMKWKIQRLEQENDELETSARIAQATIEDLRHKSETLLEQNVFLQHEKEEVLKKLSSIIIAEVHPADMNGAPPGRATSARYSRKSSSCLVEALVEPPTSPAVVQESVAKGKKKKGRRPEVLETCLHLTCRKCRANKPHSHNGGSDERGSIAEFFERLRVFLFGSDH
ncbi:hypothetical protein PHYBOEH_006710 [Phytophthora boehmeriae]|uniref:Uncharacterized protein n=1 Tax=Phytophthora boehmeriae TaxID=109152 RepID=A0A8T1X3M2_9STRA|nr:hypothetical protein PHYBOEH_006710 [Phytophthora boehmeriae]